MHLSKSFLGTWVLLWIALGVYSQDIVLSSDNKHKTIKAGTFIEVKYSIPNSEPGINNGVISQRGKLVSNADGKVNMLVTQSRESLVENNKNIGHITRIITKIDAASIQSIAHDDILAITRKGEKQIRRRSIGDVIGKSLFFVGVGHMISAPISGASDADAGNLLWIIGGVEALTGIAIGSFSKQKVFITSQLYPSWESNRKIWELE